MKRITKPILILLLLGLFAIAPAYASIIKTISGTSDLGTSVTFQAELEIVGDNLTVVLSNNSPVASTAPNDIFTSFYWDIVNTAGDRPALSYESAVGDVYTLYRNATDTLTYDDKDLVATATNLGTWQYKTMDPAYFPFLGFGIGTAGNTALPPNNFDGSLVGTGRLDYGIYTGEFAAQNLDGTLQVKNTATFTFSGVYGFSESDISDMAVFGLGTTPDSTITFVPIPATAWIFGAGLIGLVGIRRKVRS